jgi:hypothetical protein
MIVVLMQTISIKCMQQWFFSRWWFLCTLLRMKFAQLHDVSEIVFFFSNAAAMLQLNFAQVQRCFGLYCRHIFFKLRGYLCAVAGEFWNGIPTMCWTMFGRCLCCHIGTRLCDKSCWLLIYYCGLLIGSTNRVTDKLQGVLNELFNVDQMESDPHNLRC